MRSTGTQLWREGGREGGREGEREGGREGGREREGEGEGEGVIGIALVKISELTQCGKNNAQICTNQGNDNFHEYRGREGGPA